MSIGPMGGVFASAAGSPAAQAAGSDVERTRQDAVSQQRQSALAQQADNAAGIAETDGKDHETNDRDADGRRLWEIKRTKPRAESAVEPRDTSPPPSKDASGNCGQTLDLTG